MRMKNAFAAILVVLGLTVLTVHVPFAAEPKYEYVDDATITAKANEMIAEDPDTQSLKIYVDTTAGNVVLMGSVNSKVTRERLVSRVKMIKGVKSVRSLLKMEENEDRHK